MSATRWLSALLLVTLILSSAPVVSAAPAAAPAQQEPAAASSTSYLLVVTPPAVSIPPSTGAMQVAGRFNVEHARYYSMIESRLAAWQQQGAITGFTAEPSAYAFVVHGATPAVLGELAALGELQPTGGLSAAAVDGLSSTYQEGLQAAIAAAAYPLLESAPSAAPVSAAHIERNASLRKPGIAANGFRAANGDSPDFEIQLHSPIVLGSNVAPGTFVTATLKTAAGVVKGMAHSVSEPGFVLFLVDMYGNPVFVESGDILEVQVPELITIPVVDLRTSINTATRMATGFAPANVTNQDWNLRPLLSFNIAQGIYITTTPSGTFSWPTLDVPPGRQWSLSFHNAEGQETYLDGEIPILVLRGEYADDIGCYGEDEYPVDCSEADDALVSGAVLDANAVLTVTLTRAGSPPIVNYTRSNMESAFSLHLQDPYFNEVQILAGDTVQVTGGGVTLSATVPTFNVVSDPSSDTVSGTTNATVVTDTINLTQTLAIFPNSVTEDGQSGYGKMALAPGGSFSVGNDFYLRADPDSGSSLPLNWLPGALGHLRYINADGNVIFAGFNAVSQAPILSLRGHKGYEADNEVNGEVNVSGIGFVSLLDANNVVKARKVVSANPDLSVDFQDVYGNPLPIADGDSVVATFDGHTTIVNAPEFTIAAEALTSVVTGRITGGLVTTTTADAPLSLAVYPAVGSTEHSINVQPDANGDFSVTFFPTVTLHSGDEGYVKYIDANLNTVFAKWQVPVDKPTLSLRGSDNYGGENLVYVTLPPYVQQSPCNATISIVVKAQDQTVRWQRIQAACSSPLSIILGDGLGDPVNLNPGDIVQATFEGKTATAVVPSFSVLSDPKTATVAGTTNATVTASEPGLTQTLAIWPIADPPTWGKYALVDDGAFKVGNPFYRNAEPGQSQDIYWEPGDEGYLRYIDADGNSIFATFGALTEQPVLDIQKGSNRVKGFTPVSGGPVTVKVKSGSAIKGVGSVNTSLGGKFDMQIFDGVGNPIRIAEGDVVEFTPPLTTVVVPALTAIVDVDNDSVSGEGPPNAQLNLSLTDGSVGYEDYSSITVATDKDGNYAVDLRGLIDIRSGMWGKVEYRNPDGQTIHVDQPAGTVLAGGLNTSRVWGLAPGYGTTVQVTLQRGSSIVGMATVVAGEGGYFTAFLIDVNGRPVIEQAGDILSASFGSGGSRTFTLVPLQMSVDLATNTVRGAGPIGSLLGVEVFLEQSLFEHLDATVLTDAGGQWSLDLNAWLVSIEAGDTATLFYSDNGSDLTWLGAVAPVFWVRSSYPYQVDANIDEGVVNNLVAGYVAAYTPVMVTVKRNGGVLAFETLRADEWGYYGAYLEDRNGLDADILAGDVVEVQSVSALPWSVTVPVMTAVANSQTGMITGVGPANAAMGLFMTPYGRKTVHTGADGTFATPFPQNIVAAGAGSGAIVLTYREPQGNWVRASTGQSVVEPAHMEVRWAYDISDYNSAGYLAHAVSGSAGAPLTQVQLALHRGGAVIATAAVMSDQSGYFTAALRGSDGQPVDILGGDVIEMAAGEITKSLTVPDLTAQANLESHTLYGAGPANAPLSVEGFNCDNLPTAYTFEEFAIDPNGKWVLPCPELDHQASGWIKVQDLQGNSTYLSWSVPNVEVRVNGNYVDGTLVTEAEASVQLWRSNVMVASTMVTANEENGWFEAWFLGSGGRPFIILPGDTVIVAYGNESIVVPVVSLSAAVDNDADRVTGVGPARQNLVVDVSRPQWWDRDTVTRDVTTGDDGAYMADFAGVRDIQGGDYIKVSHMNPDGNVVYLEHAAALVRINLGNDMVDGYATPNSMASIVLKRGGDVIASTKAPTAMDGAFSAYFLDNDGNVINLIPGDVVEVTASPTVATSAVGLTAVLDPTLDRISGSAPAGAAVLVIAYRCIPSECYSYSATAIADAGGSYSVDLAGTFELDLTSYAYVQVEDGKGNMTSFATTPSEVPQLTDVEGSLQAAGATILASAFGTGNPGNLTPPMALTAVGPGKLVFASTGGTLVVTAPDGTIMRSEFGYLSVANPLTGRWLVQVLVNNGVFTGNGTQYTMAAGQGLYTVYMPIVKQQTKK